MNPPRKLVLLRVIVIAFAIGVLSCQVIRRQKQANEARGAVGTTAQQAPVYSGGSKWGPVLSPHDVSTSAAPMRAPGSKFGSVFLVRDLPLNNNGKTQGTLSRLFRVDKRPDGEPSRNPLKETVAKENPIDELVREATDDLLKPSTKAGEKRTAPVNTASQP